MDMSLSHVKQEKGKERAEQENQLRVPRGPKPQKESVAKMVELYRKKSPAWPGRFRVGRQGIPASRVL